MCHHDFQIPQLKKGQLLSWDGDTFSTGCRKVSQHSDRLLRKPKCWDKVLREGVGKQKNESNHQTVNG